jgi:hypothetical protein
MSDNKKETPAFYPNDNIQFNFGDLYQVKSNLESYELRNISRIVNVLGGQYTEIIQEHEEITEEDSYSEFEKETNEEQSLTTSTTEAMESSATSYQDKENSFAVSGQVKANFGTVQAQVDSSYDNQNGSGSSKSNAQSYAKTVVESSRKSVRTRVLNTKRKNTQIRDLETKKIGLDNRGGANFVGVYRNVSEVHKAQLVKHHKHLFAKIYIPTPSENYSKHISGALTANTKNPVGLKFTKIKGGDKIDLTFSNLIENDWLDDNWLELAAEFGIQEPIPKPLETSEIVTSVSDFNKDPNPSHKLFTATMVFNVPDGFIPILARIGNVNRIWEETVYLEYALPNKDYGSLQRNKKQEIDLEFGLNEIENIRIQGNKFNIDFMCGVSLATLLSCEMIYKPSTQLINLWRLNFYNQILEAAEGKPTIEDKLGLSRRVNVLSNADAAKKLIKEELERETIQYVLGTDLKGFDSHWRNLAATTPEENYPEINMDKTNALQSVVGFLSNAFDFDKMSYRFLPAYLGAESNRSKLFDSKNTGEIRDFIQASWAEVILPIRRGEEYKLFYMLETGLIWSSSDDEAPLPNKRQYLALSEEIEEDRALTAGTETEEEVVDDWTFNLPTAFEILQEGSNINGTPVATESANGITSKPE